MTFQYGQITASSPIAFRTPVLSLPAATAVVSIHKALDALPASVSSATLEELADYKFSQAREIARRDLSPVMHEAFVLWLDAAVAYWSHRGEDDEGYTYLCQREDEALERVLEAECGTPADHDLINYFGFVETFDAAPLGKGLQLWAEIEGGCVSDDPYMTSARAALLWHSPLVRALAFGDAAIVYPDNRLLAAFAAVRRGMAELIDESDTCDEYASDWEERCAEHDDIIRETRAQTVEGVIAKLRVAFQHIAGQAWSDHAVVDPTHPKFVNEFSDGNNRMLWDCIEDLARIGGIDLSKQGADQRAMVFA